jgi:hypothetical protein
MQLKKPNPILRKEKEQINKKAIYWIAGSLVGIVIIVSILLIFNI